MNRVPIPEERSARLLHVGRSVSQPGRDVAVNVDDDRQLFGGWEGHGFEDAFVDKRGQLEQIQFDLPWEWIFFIREFSLKDTPYPLGVFQRFFQFCFSAFGMPAVLAAFQFQRRLGKDPCLCLTSGHGCPVHTFISLQ